MRTAIIVVGQMRTWETCLHTLKWHVARKLDQPFDLFISTVRDEQATTALLTKQHFPDSEVHIDIKNQPDIPEPVELVRFEPYARSVPVQGVLRQLWQLNEAWKQFSAVEAGKYDVVIRTRPDLFFHSFEMPSHGVYYYTAHTPWWGRFGGVNDRFAIMGFRAAQAYFSCFANLERLLAAGAPLHPESLVKGALEMADCAILDNLLVEFSTLRMNGEMRQPEISPIDLAHSRMRVLTR